MATQRTCISRIVEIVTPAPPGSLHGNRMTALRWGKFLRNLGYRVRITDTWSGKQTDLLIALHALRSHQSIDLFKKTFPVKPIILIVTGTDLYRDMQNYSEVNKSMKMANAIVVLQSAALDSIPQSHQHKTHVIYQSIKSIKRKTLLQKSFLVSVIGHLRPEKDPFCTPRALQLLPANSPIRVIHLGKAMSDEMQQQALLYSLDIQGYQWLGECSHAKTLQHLSRCHLMVISSLMEGGAHVVSEAIAIGVPVLASDIPGNRGLLGNDYPGYFAVGNEVELGNLLLQAQTDQIFYQSMVRHIQTRQKYVLPEFEMQSIKRVVNSVMK
jgi:putative glycosyltransferase (TIGR04348 family)